MYFPVIRNTRNNWLDTAFNDLFDMDWTPRHVTTLKKEFCKVNIDNEGNLVVKIENKAEHEEKSCKDESEKYHYVRREFSYANYEQTYILPDEVDKEHISAKVEDGILSIELPKLAPQPEKKMDRVIDIA